MRKLLTTLFATLWIGTSASAAERPNVLFVFADDMTFESIGAYGLTDCKTPNLDRLVKNGATFSQAYNMGAWNGAVCVASRAMLNSGAFVNRAQVAVKEKSHWSEMMKGVVSGINGESRVKLLETEHLNAISKQEIHVTT